MKWTVALALLMLGCAEADTRLSALEVRRGAIIYDEDDRHEVYQASEALRKLAALSVAAVIPKTALQSRGASEPVQLLSASLRDSYDLCEGEAFLEQPAAATCTAVLVDDNLVLTAGHCVASPGACEDLAFVFDYYYRAPAQLERIHAGEVLACRRIVSRGAGQSDYAWIELDGDTRARLPVKPGGSPQMGQQLAVIGTPSGVPLKVEEQAQVIDLSADEASFRMASDTFEGSSGSPIIDSRGELIGIFAKGAPDFELVDAGCHVARHATADAATAGGERAFGVAPMLEALCATGWHSERLCGPACDEVCADATSPASPEAGMEEGEEAHDAGEIDAAAVGEPSRGGSCSLVTRPTVVFGFHAGWLALLLLLWRRRGAAEAGTARGSAQSVRST